MLSATRVARRNEGRAAYSRQTPVNVGETERVLSAVGGGALALAGLARRDIMGLGMAAFGAALLYRGLSGHCHFYGSLGFHTADRPPATAVPAGSGAKVETSVTVNRPAGELYHRWRDLQGLPRFMSHLESVTVNGPRSHWVARGPLGQRVEWDAEIHNERAGELIAWRSVEGSEVDTAGSVHFSPAPGGQGTVVRVSLKYDPPAGKAGATLAWLLGESPEGQVREDLRRFKQMMESGEVATTSGQPSGRA